MYTEISPLTATHAHEGRSSRYQFISTQDVITTFNEQGFEVTSVQYPKVRKHDKLGFNSHIVRMRQTNLSSYNEEVPEVLLINSHDGTKAFRLGLGFFRFVCSNGLIVGDFMADTGRITHKGQVAVEVLNFVSEYSKNVSQKILQISDMKNTVLSSSEIEEFQIKAAEIIHPSLIQAQQLMHINRLEDKGEPTIWKAFNVAQENAMKGNYQITGATNNVRKARPIKDITRNIQVNSKLWSLAESFIIG